MTRSPVLAGYSATVTLKLIADGRTLELAQIGPGMICLREPCSLPSCDAVVLMTVDGRERRWSVNLPEGASMESAWVRTVDFAPREMHIANDAAMRK